MEVLLFHAFSRGTREVLWEELGAGVDSLLLEWRNQCLLPFSHLDMTEIEAFFVCLLLGVFFFIIQKKKLNCGGMERQSKVEEGINNLFYLPHKGSYEDSMSSYL